MSTRRFDPRDAKLPLLLFPEGTVTGMQVALLRFEKGVFEKDVPIVPVAHRSLVPLPFWIDILAFDDPLVNIFLVRARVHAAAAF